MRRGRGWGTATDALRAADLELHRKNACRGRRRRLRYVELLLKDFVDRGWLPGFSPSIMGVSLMSADAAIGYVIAT